VTGREALKEDAEVSVSLVLGISTTLIMRIGRLDPNRSNLNEVLAAFSELLKSKTAVFRSLSKTSLLLSL
jgi:hypothetical protein